MYFFCLFVKCYCFPTAAQGEGSVFPHLSSSSSPLQTLRICSQICLFIMGITFSSRCALAEIVRPTLAQADLPVSHLGMIFYGYLFERIAWGAG